jgi:hypothetical protein
MGLKASLVTVEEKNFQTLLGIKPLSSAHPACSLVTILIELPQLLLPNSNKINVY